MSEEETAPRGFPLTDEQRAALKLGSNLALTAGAGTGKTTTLTERYRTILDTVPEVGPQNILTLTFTKDAAGEMREKIREAIDDELAAADAEGFGSWRSAKDDLEDAYIHTIHAFCSRILREFAVEAGVHPDFETLDEGEADEVIDEAITAVLDRCGADDGLDERAGRLEHASELDDMPHEGSVWDPLEELETLTQLYSRSNLASALSSLFDERPDSVAWAERWADQTPADYQAHCATFVESSIDREEADELIETDRAQRAIAEIMELAARDLDVPATDNGMALLEELSSFLTETAAHGEDGNTTDRQRFLLKVADGVTTGSGSLYSGSHYYAGAKTNWDGNGYGDERTALKDALDTLADLIEPEECNLDHDPVVELNGARLAIALARIFQITREEYQRYKQRRNALDYSDLITKAISFLGGHETARRTLRDQFEYIMVDEVQDTDPRQWALVKLLSGDDADGFDGQNVFLVGDEKQSIYRFRDADVTQFRTARERLVADNPPGVDGDLELTGNFRTVDPTLTTINELFDAVLQPGATADDSDAGEGVSDAENDGPEHEPYEAEPQWLTAEREDGQGIEGSVEYLLVPDDEETDDALGLADSWYTESEFISKAEREAKAVASRLTQLFAADTDVWDPKDEQYTTAQPRHVALLFRSSRRLGAFERELEAHDIPYTNLAGSGFYETPEMRPLVNLLKVFEDPHATIPLYGVLRSPLFGFTDDTLTSAYAPDASLWDGLAGGSPELQAARDTIARWRTQAGLGEEKRVQHWSTLLSSIVDETGYFVGIGADERPQQAVANVEKFRQQLRNWEEGSAQSITAVIDRIEATREGDEDPSEATIPGDIEGVQLRTIHSAKGLEFPIVVVPEITRQFYMRSSIPKGHFERIDGEPILGLKAPEADRVYSQTDTATYQHVREHYQRRERAEQRRLLYVAATRTRDHLILSGTHSVDEETDSGLPDPGDWDEARSWRDWVQPTLLEEPNLVTRLRAETAIETAIDDGPYTIRRPTAPADWAPESTDETVPSDIEIPAPERTSPKLRLSASQFRDRLSELDTPELLEESREARHAIGDQSDRETALDQFDSASIGSIVHKLCELEPERSEWPAIIRRLIDDNDELSDAAIAEIVRQTETGLEAVNELESGSSIQSRHSELNVTLDLEVATVVGDIDHLSVVDNGYIITDFKTSTVDKGTIADRTEHYYLQLLGYAGALIQSDTQADRVKIAVAYTDAGITRSRTLTREEITVLQGWASDALGGRAR